MLGPAKAVPEHVTYLIVGAGTASVAAFRAIKSRDAKAKVSLCITYNTHMVSYLRRMKCLVIYIYCLPWWVLLSFRASLHSDYSGIQCSIECIRYPNYQVYLTNFMHLHVLNFIWLLGDCYYQTIYADIEKKNRKRQM